MHDSSGNVVLEAMSNGLPVVCLDLGGPAQIVTPECGAIVRTTKLKEPEVIESLSRELLRIGDDPLMLKQLRAGAISRSREFAWSSQVGSLYDVAGEKSICVF